MLSQRPRRDRDVQPSRPRRDETFQKTSRDCLETETFQKNVSRTQCRSLKTPTGEVCHLTTCFFRFRYIIFFVIYSHFMHLHKTKVTRPRPRRYIFKTEMRPRRWTLKTEMRPRRSIFSNSRDRDVEPSRPRRDRDVRFFQTLETETFNLQDRDETFQKNVSRPPWDRDVQDRDYIPAIK